MGSVCGATPSLGVLGGLLGALHLGLKNAWINSYWGGAFAAFAGALLFGALWRLAPRPRPGPAFLAGLGWSLAWLVRPYESLLLFAILWGLLLWRTLERRGPRGLWVRCAAAAGLPILAALALTLLHNHRVTGSPLVLPYQHAQRHHGVPQSLVIQDPVPMPAGLTSRQREVYEWQRRNHHRARARWAGHLIDVAWDAVAAYVNVFLITGVAGLLWFRRRTALASAMLIILLAILVSALYFFSCPTMSLPMPC